MLRVAVLATSPSRMSGDAEIHTEVEKSKIRRPLLRPQWLSGGG